MIGSLRVLTKVSLILHVLLVFPDYKYRKEEQELEKFRPCIEKFLKKQLQESKQCFEQGTQKQPDFWPVRYNLGVISLLLKDWERALKEFDLSIQISKSYVPAFLAKAYCQAKLGDYRGSIDTILAVEPQLFKYPHARYNLAVAYLELGELQKANEAISKVLSIDGQHFWGLTAKALLMIAEDRVKEGQELCLDLKKIWEDNPALLSCLGLAEMNLKNFVKAAEYFELAYSKSPTESNLMNWWLAFLRLGDFKKLKTFLKSEKFKAKDPQFDYLKALAWIALGNNSKGIEYLKKSSEKNFLNARLLLALTNQSYLDDTLKDLPTLKDLSQCLKKHSLREMVVASLDQNPKFSLSLACKVPVPDVSLSGVLPYLTSWLDEYDYISLDSFMEDRFDG